MEEALPTLHASSDADFEEFALDWKLCNSNADCGQIQPSQPSCITEAVKIEPCDEQQSNCDSGLPAGLLEVEKEENFFMEEDVQDTLTITDAKYIEFPAKAEPVEAVVSPSIPQAPPANQELPTTVDVFTPCQAAPDTACLVSTSLEVHNSGAPMTPHPSETSISKGKDNMNGIEILSTDHEANETHSRNIGALPPASAPSVNCTVIGFNGTRTASIMREPSCETKASPNCEEVKPSNYYNFKFTECHVLLTRIHVPENYICTIEEQNGGVNIVSKKKTFFSSDANHGKNSERTEGHGKDTDKTPYINEENTRHSSANTYLHPRILLNHSKLPCASPDEIISVSNSRGHLEKKKPFKCHLCSSAFRLKYYLGQHYNTVHLKLKPFKCSKCDYAASQISNLRTHFNAVHAKLKRFNKCTICCKNFASKHSLQQHVSSAHLKIKPYKCPHCEHSAISKSQITRHISAVHLMTQPHKCNLCDYSASTKLRLDSHFASVHSGVRPYKCSDCDYASTSKDTLKTHIKAVHLKVKPHKCNLCDYAATKKVILVDHIASVHHKLKRYKCQECDYAAATRGKLTQHVKAVHMKLKPFKCDECDRNFSLKTNLKAHISRVHIKSKPHVCPHCPLSMWSKAGLATHVASVHLKLKPHKCPQCDYTGSTKGRVDSHVDAVHLKLRPHKCQTCKRGFFTKQDLEKHIESVHVNSKEHKCSECKFSTSSKPYLKIHVDSVHRKQRFQCSHCDYTSGFRGYLKKHVDVVHLNIKKHKCGVCEHRFAQKSNLMSHVAEKH